MPPALGLCSIITGRTGSLTKTAWHFPIEDAVFSFSGLCQISAILFGFECANFCFCQNGSTASWKSFSKNTLFWTCYKFLANFSLPSASALSWKRGREQESSVLTAHSPSSVQLCLVLSASAGVLQTAVLLNASLHARWGAHEKIHVVFSVCSLFMPLNLFRVLLNRTARKVTKPSFSRHNCSLCSQTSPS